RRVGGIFLRHGFRDTPREGEEVGVLGHEVGLAVHFHHRGQLAVRRQVSADDPLGRDARSRLARLGAALDAQQLFGFLEVAVGFLQRLLAFHHAETGHLAQFLHNACGNCRHASLRRKPLTRGMRSGGSLDRLLISWSLVQQFEAPQNEGAFAPWSEKLYAALSDSTSTNSSPRTISSTTWALPSRMASATPRAYRRMARLESSLPGMT